jgi:acyl-CoA thioesterase
MTFADLLADAQGGDGTLRIAVPETWHQGRTAYGGFSAALALAAAMRAGGEGLPPLRSAQFAMIAPVAGEVDVRAQVLRRGRNATWVSAELACGGAVAFTASLVFMGAVASALHLNEARAPAPLVPPAEARDVTYTGHTRAMPCRPRPNRRARCAAGCA